MAGEGASGWRGLVAAAAVASRQLGFGLVLPCVRDSELVCCFEEDDDCEADYKSALRLAEARSDVVVGTMRPDALDLNLYFDIDNLERYVGAPVVSPRCLPPGSKATAAPSSIVETRGGLAELAQSSNLIAIHDIREGIFGLGPYRNDANYVAEASALFSENDELPLRIAPERRRDALRFVGIEPYDVIMWRSELVSVDAMEACAEAVFQAAGEIANEERKLVFVSDIAATALQAGGRATLWDGHHSRKKKKGGEDRLDRVRRDLLFNLSSRHDVSKYDFSSSGGATTDRGAVGLTEQYIATNAERLWVQRSFRSLRRRRRASTEAEDDDTADFVKPGLGRCGWEGRFLTTVLAARHAAEKPTSSWFDSFFVE